MCDDNTDYTDYTDCELSFIEFSFLNLSNLLKTLTRMVFTNEEAGLPPIFLSYLNKYTQ